VPRQAERYYLGLRHSRPHDAWWACAQTELWLLEPKAQPPKEQWICARSEAKPRLDGRLDEPMWRLGNAIDLRSSQRDDAEWGAVAMLAYDDEFLYVAVSCTQAAGFEYSKTDQPVRVMQTWPTRIAWNYLSTWIATLQLFIGWSSTIAAGPARAVGAMQHGPSMVRRQW